jgi:hypothetical protein
MTDQFLTEDEWEERYKPGEVLEDFPEGTPAHRIWTEIESEGFWSLAPGTHLVNRTGRYYVSEIPHNFDVFVEDPDQESLEE